MGATQVCECSLMRQWDGAEWRYAEGESGLNFGSAVLRPCTVSSSDLALVEVEKAHILRVIELADQNRSKAARVLGLDRRTLYRRLRSYGVT